MSVHVFRYGQSEAVVTTTSPAAALRRSPLQGVATGAGGWWSRFAGGLSKAVAGALRMAVLADGDRLPQPGAASWRTGRRGVSPRTWRRHSAYLVYGAGRTRRAGR